MMVNEGIFWTGYLIAQGTDPATVAERYGISAGDLAELMVGYVPPAYPPGHEALEVWIAARHRTKIGIEASRRGLSMPDLASATLQAIVRDDLFGAVL